MISTSQKADENRSYLGPNPELMKKKEEAKQKEMQEKLNRKREDVKALTEEEKERRLQAMLKDAELVDSKRVSQVKSQETSHSTKDDENTGKAQFLSSMRTEVYNTAAESGLKDRLDQNRYYRQGSADLEGASNFLRKQH